MRRTRTKPGIWILVFLVLAALVYGAVSALGGLGGSGNPFRSPDIEDREIRKAFQTLSEKNPEAAQYVANFKGVTEYDLELDLSSEVTAGAIPYFTQWDSRWGYCRYGEGLIGYTGCGPTALSMVAMGLTGNGKLTPAYIADFSTREGYCVPGNGTAWLLFSEGAEKLGLTAEELPLWEPTMRDELNRGHPIICIMGPGHFTETGHYIVLTACNGEGFQVYDPNRPSNCHTWAYVDLSGEIRNLWSYSLP